MVYSFTMLKNALVPIGLKYPFEVPDTCASEKIEYRFQLSFGDSYLKLGTISPCFSFCFISLIQERFSEGFGTLQIAYKVSEIFGILETLMRFLKVFLEFPEIP